MEPRRALRWALYYRGLSLVAAAVGWLLVGIGVAIGLNDPLSTLLTGDGVVAALDSVWLPPVVVFGVLGVLVWQLGRTAAFYGTLTAAVEEEMADRFDSQKVKSDILSVLDERLSDMHLELERTRRGVDDLTEHTSGEEEPFQFGK